MADDTQKFGNNPFAHLQLPNPVQQDGVKRSSAVEARLRHKKKPQHAENIYEDEDSALFLQAMSSDTRSVASKTRGGFTLEDQAALPRGKALRRKKSCRASDTIPAVAQQTTQDAGQTAGQPIGQNADQSALQGGAQAAQKGGTLSCAASMLTECGHSATTGAGSANTGAAARQGATPTGALHGYRNDVKSYEKFMQSHDANGEGGEEADAFLHAMGGVTPLSGKGRDVAPPVAATQGPEAQNLSMQEFMETSFTFALSLTGEYMEGYVLGLDELTMNKLRAGQYSPEAHIDLHGLNAIQAYESLVGFFRSAWYKGLRTVLVVPGRGKNSPDGVGILRDKLQLWLTQEPFKRVVLAFCTAKPTDGGFGGVYVMLRKMRKKGKIYWERLPADPDLF